MSDFSKDGQLTFDFGDFSEPDSVSSEKKTGQKVADDLTPGLFDPDGSEEEEMESFLQTLRSSGSSGEADHADPQPELGPELPAETSAEESEPTEKKEKPEKALSAGDLTRKHLQRAALAFLASLDPSGLALDVPARGERCKAGAAAFWQEAGKVVRTALVEIRTSSDALLQTAGHEEQFQQLKLARMERDVLEQEIRRTEPGLRDSSMLFSEFEHWNYEETENPAYRECLKRIRQLEHSIFHGSRLERFQTGRAATELYLAVPENAVLPDALADGWGLIYVKADLSCELVKAPVAIGNIPEENLVRLALRIAAANVSNTLFANGIRPAADGGFKCGRLPRQRHLKF